MTNLIKPFIVFIVVSGILSAVYGQQVNHVWLDDLQISSFSEGIPGVSVKANANGDSMKLQGNYFDRGIGTQSLSVLSFFLDGKAKKFTTLVGADDNGNKTASVKFYVIGDKKILFESGAMKVGDTPKNVNLDLTGIKHLGLLVT